MKYEIKYSRISAFFCILLTLLTTIALAEDADNADSQDLFDMSLTELLDVEIDVPATITEKNPLKTPASVTVITAEDIARTPARNILDLIETYVPGALYMNHSVGPLPGIRGVLVDRPYKFLVNINGINVNIKAHYGARLELLNWDLNDIARIEIVRGPGSVTYGPGAIGGVINIYTKSGKQAPGLNMGSTYWGKYNSIGNYVSFGESTDEKDLFSYFSVVHTDGITPDLFGVNSSPTSGYVGSSGGPYSPNPAASYMSDFYNEPQIKAHVDYRLQNDWRLWARYVNSSSSLVQGSALQYLIDGEYKDFRETRYRYYQFVLEKKTPITDNWNLKSTFGLSSIDVHNVEKWDGDIENYRDNLLNVKWIWSENEFYNQFMFNYKPDEGKLKGALGFEFSYDTIGPAWGKDEDEGLRLADGIMSGPTSEAYGTIKDGSKQFIEGEKEYFAVGDGWETRSIAFLGELNYQHTPDTTTLWSARLDKHSYTGYMFSPRFAWIRELDTNEYLKFIAQRSVRMNTQEELYMNHIMNKDNDPEKLNTLELIYSDKPTERLSFQSSVFYNRNDVIAWDWGQARSAPVGTLDTMGLEIETGYKKDNYRFGINHSYVKQLDWDLDDNVAVSGISYSDYYVDAGSGVVITSNGDDLNNWSNHATKLYGNIDFLEGRMSLFANMKALWGFQGRKDGLDALEDAGGDAATIADIRDRDTYDLEIAANLSLTYRINKLSTMTVFVQNIPVIGDNKRYSYSSGFKKTYPDKVSWIEEPTVVGISYMLKF
ncbi:MAG: TonB-dependent receptor [Sedimentisphaerales bacterium]|nr:TonB-dependent receptor [Sedimentisphaerales bacterium]